MMWWTWREPALTIGEVNYDCKDVSKYPVCRYLESQQTKVGIARVRSWAKAVALPPHSLLISGNTDEVLSQATLQQLAWCKVVPGPFISGALWMPLGSLDRAWRTDYPVEGRPHTHSLPTIYRWEEVADGRQDGSRLQIMFKGRRDKYMMGGMHMSNPAFLPLAILKEITASETDKTRNINSFYVKG